MVGIIDVQIIGAEAPQAVFDGLQDVFPREAGVVGAWALFAGHF
jgi:hypothetical protein